MNLSTLKEIDIFLTPAERWFMHHLEEDLENAMHCLSIWSDYIEEIYHDLQNYPYDRTHFITHEHTDIKALSEFIDFIDGNGFCVYFSGEPGVFYEVKIKSNT